MAEAREQPKIIALRPANPPGSEIARNAVTIQSRFSGHGLDRVAALAKTFGVKAPGQALFIALREAHTPAPVFARNAVTKQSIQCQAQGS